MHAHAYLQCDTWPDEWTAVTRDGSRSAQFEHTLLITNDGYEILTARCVFGVGVWCFGFGVLTTVLLTHAFIFKQGE